MPSYRLPTIIQVRTLSPSHPVSGEHERSLGGGQSLFGNDPVVPRRITITHFMYTILRLARGDHSRRRGDGQGRPAGERGLHEFR